MQTYFSSQTLAEVFRDIYLSERSGVLHLSRSDEEKRIYFDRGMILFAESAHEDEDLGPRLVNEGKISSGALAEARKSISDSKDLAQALINRGLIGKETLSHTVHYIVEKVVRSVFQWEGGTARFSEGWLLQEIFESDIVSTLEVILKGISTMVGFAPIKEALEAQDSALKQREPNPIPLERLALGPSHGFVLSRIDGSTRLSAVLSILPEDEVDHACRFLYGLLVMGVLEFDPALGSGTFNVASILQEHADLVALEKVQDKAITEAFQRLRDKNPFEVLGIPPDAGMESIEHAYEDAKAAFGRDRFLRRIRDKRRSHLAFIESRLVEAYLSLVHSRQRDARTRKASRQPVASDQDDVTANDLLVRVEMDKTAAKKVLEQNSKTAEMYYSKARKAFGEGDFHDAIQYGKLAISYNPEDARYFFLLADCQSRNPESRWQRWAEQNFIRAAELDPWNPEYWISLGRFYKKQGLALRARKQFEQALEIAPKHEAAIEELQTLE